MCDVKEPETCCEAVNVAYAEFLVQYKNEGGCVITMLSSPDFTGNNPEDRLRLYNEASNEVRLQVQKALRVLLKGKCDEDCCPAAAAAIAQAGITFLALIAADVLSTLLEANGNDSPLAQSVQNRLDQLTDSLEFILSTLCKLCPKPSKKKTRSHY